MEEVANETTKALQQIVSSQRSLNSSFKKLNTELKTKLCRIYPMDPGSQEVPGPGGEPMSKPQDHTFVDDMTRLHAELSAILDEEQRLLNHLHKMI